MISIRVQAAARRRAPCCWRAPRSRSPPRRASRRRAPARSSSARRTSRYARRAPRRGRARLRACRAERALGATARAAEGLGRAVTAASPRRVASILLRGGATARGVGIGAALGRDPRRVPNRPLRPQQRREFGITLVRVPKSGGGSIEFALDTRTRRVTLDRRAGDRLLRVAAVQLALISDTHMPRGARAIPAPCLERCAAADAILHAGDLSDVSVLELLRSLGPPVHAIHGNVDSTAVRRLLPGRIELQFDGARIGIVHDPGRAVGRLERAARGVPALRRGRLRPHAHAGASRARGLCDLQPRLADRAPAGARSHDRASRRSPTARSRSSCSSSAERRALSPLRRRARGRAARRRGRPRRASARRARPRPLRPRARPPRARRSRRARARPPRRRA